MSDRHSAAMLFQQGVRRSEVARRLGVSRSTATEWYRRWCAGGAEALTRARRPGRKPKLTMTGAVDRIHNALEGTPRDAGFDLDQWSLASVSALIARTTGVSYHPRHVVRVLRRFGWVVAPVGASAQHAFRQSDWADPDGNALLLRLRVRSARS